MKIIFTLLLIIFLAFSGYHLSFRQVRLKLPMFARLFYLTGIEFLFLGLLLGPQLLDILDPATQKGLAPLSALVLGWIGILYGFQFEIAKLRKYPLEYMAAANLEGLLTLVVVFLGAWWILPFLLHIPDALKTPALFLLAGTSACSAQTGLVLMTPAALSRRGTTLQLLRYISAMDGLIALLVFSLAFVFYASLSDLSRDFYWMGQACQNMVFSISATIGLLFLFILFLNKRLPEKELILVVMGMVILTSGMALVLNFSPLLTNFFVGFWLVNLTREKERIYNILVSVEKPAYILLLVFLGARWEMNGMLIFMAAAGYCIFRAAGKMLSGVVIARFIREPGLCPYCLGYGLLDQGGLAFAMLLDFSQRFSDHDSVQIISVILLAIVLNDLLAPQFLKKFLQETNNEI